MSAAIFVGLHISNSARASGLVWSACIATFKATDVPATSGISLVQGPCRGTAQDVSSLAVTLTTTPTAGNVLIACITLNLRSNESVSSIANGNSKVTWTKAVAEEVSGDADAEIWYGLVSSGASTTQIITLTATTDSIIVDICEWSGLATSSPVDQTATNSGTAAAATTGTTAMTTQASELWIGAVGRYGSTTETCTPQNNFTLLDGQSNGEQSLTYLYYVASAEGAASSGATLPLQIVAAENFWGSLVSQLGGTHVQVLSIVTDPNADPHEYEANQVDARAIANARYVIVNGAGYDDWALELVSANNNPNQKVLNVANLLGKKAGDNPHFWYYPLYVNETVHQMYSDLISLDPANAEYYKQQYVNLNASLGVYNERIDEIRQQFAGTEVASTESIFEYLANATGLDLVSPPAFMEAVAEGNEPTQASIRLFQQQLESGNVSVLVYNNQTITPIAQSMESLAIKHSVAVVAITETIQPPNLPFQDWMNAELISLQKALIEKASGQ